MQTILTNKSRKLEDIQKAKKLKEEEELKECTFRPLTNNKAPVKPDVERLFEWAKAKKSKMAEIVLKKEAENCLSRSARKIEAPREKSSCVKKSAEAISQKTPGRQPGAGRSPIGCSPPPSPSPAKKPQTACKSPSFAKSRVPVSCRSASKETSGPQAITVDQLFESNTRDKSSAAKQIEKNLKNLAANVKHQQAHK